jgi:hypothetical protein
VGVPTLVKLQDCFCYMTDFVISLLFLSNATIQIKVWWNASSVPYFTAKIVALQAVYFTTIVYSVACYTSLKALLYHLNEINL